MESARLNCHIFALNRTPLHPKSTLGPYFVGNEIDCVALCEPMLMVHGEAGKVFKGARDYNPDRFLGLNPEPFSANNVMTWGAGVHLCPGKMFALYEIKVATSLILQNFTFNLGQGSVSEMNYFSPSAFAERKVEVQLVPLDANTESETKTPLSRVIQVGSVEVEIFPAGGWLLRNFISRERQEELYRYTLNLGKGSDEQAEIRSIPLNKVYPFAYENLVYTGKSNTVASALLWYEWGRELWALLQRNKDLLHFSGPDGLVFNSLYAQLFGSGGGMSRHKDQYVNWGISVSLGASAVFGFGSSSILLHSGDVLVADFSEVEHGVERILENSVPDWFNPEEVETFERLRCSIQIRDVSKATPPNIISTKEFKKMIS
jgi:alkylated DNA repair dioxygenase AlkB